MRGFTLRNFVVLRTRRVFRRRLSAAEQCRLSGQNAADRSVENARKQAEYDTPFTRKKP